ncbi:hypothetical protein [Corallococcus sp. 4LFB]|uniref:hypothetical protein n=1 Tax=Corallococcus sp. 4LFB TaxID=3383249 RepID=UPI0039767BD1
MHRMLLLAVLLCVACGDKTSPTPDAGTKGPATLIVHSDWWENTEGLGDMQGITVLLGDGSRFREPLGRDGIARFRDAAITGPQDITVVMVGDGKVLASTTLGVEGSEVWVRSGFAGLAGGFRGSRQATLTGRVTNFSGSPTQVRVVGKDFAGSSSMKGDGSFSVDVWSETAGQMALLVTGGTGQVEAVGLLRDIAVGEGRTVSDLVIPLRPLDQRLPVEVTNLQPYGALRSVSANFTLGSEYLFTTSTVGATPIQVPAMARTPPFDTVEVQLLATAGSDERTASGRVVANAPLAPEGVTRLALPAPVTLTSPTPGTEEAPGSGPRSGLTLRWSADPAVHSVTVRLVPQQGETELDWYVTGPAAVGRFTPFTLPAEVSPLRELTGGLYFVQWSSHFLGAGHDYQDLFKEARTGNEPDAWYTNAYGYSVLQD